jgi:AcrR family transcriptional regulator
MNQVDRRVQRSRKLLQEAFRQLLAEQGFDAISVQDVAERAEVNRGTFYAHFADKYALLEQVVGESFQDALLQRVPRGAPFTAENLELLTVAVLGFLGEFSSHCRPSDRTLTPLIETSMWRELYKRLLAWLDNPPGDGTKLAVAPETTATMMSWAIFGTALAWSQGPRTDTAEACAQQILTLLTGGLAQLGRPPAASPVRQLAAST